MEKLGDILGKKGLPTSAGGPVSAPEPKCKLCKDSGIVHPVREGVVDYSATEACECKRDDIRKRRSDNLMKYCQLPRMTEGKIFETFEDRGSGSVQAKEFALRLSRGDNSVIFLTLMSSSGKGKTHLAIATCREMISRGYPARYAYVPDLLDDIRESYRKDEVTGQSFSQLLTVLREVPLLALDDLGTEKKSEWACEQLQKIVDHRARSAMPLLVTTNKPLDELPNDDEGRIASRLQREFWCQVVII